MVSIRLTGGTQEHAASAHDLIGGKPPEYRRAVADGVYRAFVEAAGAPENDQLQSWSNNRE